MIILNCSWLKGINLYFISIPMICNRTWIALIGFSKEDI